MSRGRATPDRRIDDARPRDPGDPTRAPGGRAPALFERRTDGA